MTNTARILKIDRQDLNIAVVEVIDLWPWGYRIKNRVAAIVDQSLVVAEGDLVEVLSRPNGSLIVRHSQLPKALVLVTVASVSLAGTGLLSARGTLIGALSALIPLAWCAVFAGKTWALGRYLKRRQDLTERRSSKF